MMYVVARSMVQVYYCIDNRRMTNSIKSYSSDLNILIIIIMY